MNVTGVKRTTISAPIILGRTPAVKCLCPDWMCWMPWLADGEEVKAGYGKTKRAA